MAIIIFAAFAGWSFAPTPGSDAYTFATWILAMKQGFDPRQMEPVIRLLAEFVVFLDLDISWYFVFLGVLYGAFISWCAKLVFRDFTDHALPNLAAFVFMVAFFINLPVFAALNARYTLGLWILLAATLLVLRGEKRLGFAIAFLGMGVHYGHILFVGALALLIVSKYLRKWQLPAAYLFLAIAFILPPMFLLDLGSWFAGVVGGELGQKIAGSVRFGDRVLHGEIQGTAEFIWFRQWYTDPIFWSLLTSGHWLIFSAKLNRSDLLFQLWVLIVISWALYFAISGEPIAANRVQRNLTALLLLWHALWFLQFRRRRIPTLSINAVPMLFYFIVGYRLWLEQANLAAFLPTPFAWFKDEMPRVMQFLGIG